MSVGRIIVAIVCFILVFANGRAQYKDSEIKAALVTYFIKYISWPTEKSIDTLQIGYLGDDIHLLNSLTGIASKPKTTGKRIHIQSLTDTSAITGYHLLILSPQRSVMLKEIFLATRETSTLIISEESTDKLFTMIDLFYNSKTNTINFEINKQNLDQAGFSYSQEILVYGGTELDIRKLYKQTYEQLKRETEHIDRLRKDFQVVKRDKDSSEKLLRNLAGQNDSLLARVAENERRYTDITTEVESKQAALVHRDKLLSSRNQRVENLTRQLAEYDSNITVAKKYLVSLDSSIQRNESKIQEQKQLLIQKEAYIATQRRLLLVSIALGCTLILAAASLFVAFRTKKRANTRLGILVDKRTKELTESREHYRNLFEKSPLPIWEEDASELYGALRKIKFATDKDFSDYFLTHPEEAFNLFALIRVLDVNQESVKSYGAANKEELIAKVGQTISGESIAVVVDALRKIWKGDLYMEGEVLQNTLQAETRCFLVKWMVLPGHEHNYGRVLVIMTDITSIKAYESELRVHRDNLENLVALRTNEVSALNEELAATNEELYQKNQWLDDQREQLENTIRQLESTRDQLVQSEKMASLGMMIAGVAHEINTPVNFISAGYQAVNMSLNNLMELIGEYKKIDYYNFSSVLHSLEHIDSQYNPDNLFLSIEKIMDNIREGVTRITELVNSLNLYTRQGAGQLAEFDVREAIRSALVLLFNKYKGRIEIIEDYQNLRKIWCFPAQINQVFMNLLSNAMDAIDQQGTISIKGQLTDDGDKIDITISDTGCGIDKANLGKIFDPFYTTKEPGKGTGMGLYIVYRSVEQHEGVIQVHSEPGQGTRVRVILPVRPQYAKLI